eukprot:CAMPEP_0203754268 /NCGR_PEP_ID=MMETSP0098-20131031/7882_1 /ASSEMBLY_ACC=CAM_ASM_000208 /TAXON_ID=96639 /ORGANISM=" , Strain NY0313808BC1" /LENGTH=1089 /DNA_ID=CAMNT_0050645195 /DNA_START=333 /DNA_END=3599 /DNA_ORIENTATION=+
MKSSGTAQDDHIKVVVRSRPLNSEEKASKTPSLVHCDQDKNQVNVAMTLGSKRTSKAYNFDMVFGQYSTQAEVYNAAIRPVVEEVLGGFNCTVFAYGQTGTGKTYTMEGNVDDPDYMGMIPRACSSLFDALDRLDGAEYTVKVSFLELYNEELQDLLSSTDEARLRILDDKSRMNTGVACHNLEEVMVTSAEDILTQMKKAMAKRQTGETKLNKASSRSHCIFTLTLHMRETTPEGEDLLKVGKLNLVDLAGSECIGRSGAKNQRAREAGNINKSLLTLGRVISALVEKTPHIPYRDSKLTRLLQESLGGRAKTCIIATVAPSVQCLDETLSTLDYASRAKSIKNKPEANQRMTKRAVLREYAEDVERLRRELAAARAKDGVFLEEDAYNQMVANVEGQKTQIIELEDAMNQRIKELHELQEEFNSTKEVLEETQEELQTTSTKLGETQEELDETKVELGVQKVLVDETKVLVQEHQKTEAALQTKAKVLHETLDDATNDIETLHETIKRKDMVTAKNRAASTVYHEATISQVALVSDISKTFCETQLNNHEKIEESLQALVHDHSAHTELILGAIDTLVSDVNAGVKDVGIDSIATLQEVGSQDWSSTKNQVSKNKEQLLASLGEGKTNVEAPLKSVLEQILQNQDGLLAKHAEKIQSQLTTCKTDIQNFIETQKSVMGGLSEKVAQDAKENREAIQSLAYQIESFVNDEEARIETSANALAVQFSQMLVGFRTQAQTNLKTMQAKAQESCKLSVQAMLQSEKKTKESIEEVLQGTQKWCEQTVHVVDQLSSDVKQDKSELDETVVDVREKTTEAQSLLATEIGGLTALAEESEQSLQKLVSDGTNNLTAGCTSIQEKSQGILSCAESHNTKVIENVNSQEQATLEWKVLQKEQNEAGSSLVQKYSEQHSGEVAKLKVECDEYISDKLVHDEPAGTTPRKDKGYSFDRTIDRTLPHEQILESYRSGSLKSAESAEHEPLEAPKALDIDEVEIEGCENDENTPTLEDMEKFLERKSSLQSMPRTELADIGNVIVQADPEEDSHKDSCIPSSGSDGDASIEDDESSISAEDIMRMKVAQLRKELSLRQLS